MLNFHDIKKPLEEHFKKMSDENDFLYEVDLDKDALWNLYLDTIPAEHNQIYRKRREHDCSCCRHFVKQLGNIIAITDDGIETIWDFESPDPVWTQVVKALANYIKEHTISGVYISKYSIIGTDCSMDVDEVGNPIRWNHFYAILPSKFVFSGRDTIDTKRGEYRDNRNVFKRSLDELTMESVDTVLELIQQGSLYKGDEYRYNVTEFRKHMNTYKKLTDTEKELYTWKWSVKLSPSIAKIRNTAIGTLLINVSEGMDLDTAVSKYEAVTAPANYKRSKPIFSQRMLDDAQKTITELGYLDSLQRRYAKADDITVNNILFSNRDTAKRLQGGPDIFNVMSKETKKSSKKFSKVEEISAGDFINNVLPTATEVEAYVENRHIPNFMSLIAPVVPDSKTMFKWNNNFSWAYSGDVTDSILKQNVKNAGGKVDGALRFSIQWNDLGEFDGNDEDAHCQEPRGGDHIYYGHKLSRTGGNLDVDIINPKRGKAAVENITWPDITKMKNGTYKFWVRCFSARGGKSGFRAEIEFDGQIYSFDYDKPLRAKEDVPVAEVTLKDGKFTINEMLPSNMSSREIWGVHTNEFVPVSVICYSPNYWNEQHSIGHKHYFFMLKDCVNPELPSAWYNEFLNDDLYPKHRKVMEAMGYKAHVQESDDQLSGIGFSSTVRNDLVVKVKGATERIIKIKF